MGICQRVHNFVRIFVEMKRLQNSIPHRRFFHFSPFTSTRIENPTPIEEGSFSKTPNLEYSTEQRRRLIEEIVRVDHAGELGAMAIYSGQLAVLKRRLGSGHYGDTSAGFGMPVEGLIPSPVHTLQQMQTQEKAHLDEMERLLATNKVQPTILAPICHLAGYVLGVGTALMGQKSAMACTIAVEELIVGHYNEQIEKLLNNDPNANKQLLRTLSKLRDDEMEHQETAVENHGLEAPFYNTLKNAIQTGCKAAIWVTKRI